MPYRSAPWQGVSPLQSAGFTAETLARIEKSLQDDAKVPTGSIMPQPDGVSHGGDSPGQGGGNCGQGRADSGGINGRADSALGPNSAPKNDWQQARFGADAPATSIQLWEAAMLAVMAALGVPPSLYTSQGGALRESYRHLFSGTLIPLAKLIAAELSEKLEEEVTIRFPAVHLVSDISGQSRGFKSFGGGRATLLSRCMTCSSFPGDAPPEPEPEPAPVVPDQGAVPAPPGQPTPPTPPSSPAANGRASMVF